MAEPIQAQLKTFDGTKEVLLRWVQERVGPYGVDVFNFTSSFQVRSIFLYNASTRLFVLNSNTPPLPQDGKAFAALVYSIAPESYDYDHIKHVSNKFGTFLPGS